NERGKLGNIRSAKRDGLIVATPSQGMYFQFDGRQGRDDVVERDPLRVIAAVSAAYEPDSLELRSYRKVEPVIINRYDPGVELVVSGVRIDRDVATLVLAPSGAGRLSDDDDVTRSEGNGIGYGALETRVHAGGRIGDPCGLRHHHH